MRIKISFIQSPRGERPVLAATASARGLRNCAQSKLINGTARLRFQSGRLLTVGTFIASMWCVPIRAVETPAAALLKSQAGRIVMTPHAGSEKIDLQIQQAQRSVKSAADPLPQMERLGWLFVAKARESHDPGYYKLAEQCAAALAVVNPKSPESLLLRGHVLQSLHRFKEAEAVARQLVGLREFAADHGLLGDALVDQGKLGEAIVAYQRMIDLRPDLQSYSRVAHVRWLKGDLDGAIQVALLAARAGSGQDPEATAWACTRLASYLFQAGRTAEAETVCTRALELVKDDPATLLLRGKMLLVAGKSDEAVQALRIAVKGNPLPEYQWALAEAHRSAGQIEQAELVEAELRKSGAGADPRTLALFLASRGQETERALTLARGELLDRQDVFTSDALAWALFATGHTDEAWSRMEKALAEGTRDGRLFFHAGVIAAKAGHADEARKNFLNATELRSTLLPSERAHLTASFTASEAAAARRADAK